MCNFAIEPMRPCLSRGSNQSPNESLKLDTGRDLRAVGPNFIKEAVAIVIVVQKSEAKFGIDVPVILVPEPTIALHGDDGTDIKAADVRFAGQIKSLVQIIATANADVGISPILGKTVTLIELCLQDTDDSLLRCHRVSPGVSDESEYSQLLVIPKRWKWDRRPIWVERTVDEALEKVAKVSVCGSYELGGSLVDLAVIASQSKPVERVKVASSSPGIEPALRTFQDPVVNLPIRNVRIHRKVCLFIQPFTIDSLREAHIEKIAINTPTALPHVSADTRNPGEVCEKIIEEADLRMRAHAMQPDIALNKGEPARHRDIEVPMIVVGDRGWRRRLRLQFHRPGGKDRSCRH